MNLHSWGVPSYGKEIGSTDTTRFTIDSLKPAEVYTVNLTAVDQDGLESKKSDRVTVHTSGE